MAVRLEKVVTVHRLMAVIDQPAAAALARRRAARVVAWAADLARRCHRRQPAGLVHQDQGAGEPGGAGPGRARGGRPRPVRRQPPAGPAGPTRPLSVGAAVGPSRPEPEPTKPEPEPPPQPTRPPEPEPPKPEASSEQALGHGGAVGRPGRPRDRDRAAGGRGRCAGRLVAHRPVLASRCTWWATRGCRRRHALEHPPSSAAACVP
jgi:hypothetical protein